MCKWESCLKPSRQEGESFSSRVFGGLYVPPVNRVSSSAAARHRRCGKAWPRLRGGASQQLLQEGTGRGWQGVGRGRRKEKPLTLDLFHVLPNIKLFSPRSCCTAGPVAASEPKSDLSSRHRRQGAMARYYQGLCSSLLPQLPWKKGKPSPASISHVTLRACGD